jgi:hypothetical protein
MPLFLPHLIGVGQPSFHLFKDGDAYLPSVDKLDLTLTINGTTVNPTFVYSGGDADGTDWNPLTYGEDLTYNAGGGAASFNQGSPLLGTNDDSVLFDTNAYYQAAGSAFADITTEDIVFEIIFKFGATGTYPFHKRTLAGSGWTCYLAGDIRFLIRDGSTTKTLDSDNLTVGAWYHAMAFINRDEGSANGAKWYINGVVSGAGDDMSGASASLSNADNFTIGSKNDGTAGYDSNIAMAALWIQSNWHQAGAAGPTEWAALVAERFQRLTGMYPQRAAGTASPNTWGTASKRASIANLDKLESSVRYIYLVGNHWLRYCNREDSASTEINGYLSEDSVQNRCLRSQEFDNGAWVKLDAGDTVTANDTTAPNKEDVADVLIADNTDGDHGLSQAVALTTVEPWTFSVWAKKGNKNWLYLSDDTVANATCYFDLNTPAVGTSGAGATGYIEDWGNDWIRCAIVFTGTIAAHTFKIQTADADNDKSIQGDGVTKNTYLFGAQVERTSYISSYVPTVGAGVTRNGDELQFKGDDGNLGGVGSNQAGTFLCNILIEDYDRVDDAGIFQITDGGSSNDSLKLFIDDAGDNLEFFGKAATVTTININDSATDIIDGTVRSIRAIWETDNAAIYIDGSQTGTADTDCAIPDDLDEIDIGMDKNNAIQLRGIISNLKIWSFPTRKQ